MKFRIEELGSDIDAEVRDADKQGMLVKICDKEYRVDVINFNQDKVEFLLNGKYYAVKYTKSNSKELRMFIDGEEVTINLIPYASVVSKDSGAIGDRSKFLISSVPGKVVSILVKKDTQVKKGDVVIIVESMKMQVKIKAHKDGVVKELKIKEGVNIARNDIIAIIE